MSIYIDDLGVLGCMLALVPTTAFSSRADANYDLGELLPIVLSRIKDLYGTAAEASKSWGNEVATKAALEPKI